MSKTEIIDIIAKEKWVEKIVGKYYIKFRDDLSQMIYLWLLEKPEELIQELWKNKQLKYYIASMVRTQVCSVSSKYYYDYEEKIPTLNEALEVPVPEKYTLLDELCEHIDNLPYKERDILYMSVEGDKQESLETAERYNMTRWGLQEETKRIRRKVCEEMGGDLKQYDNFWKKNKKVQLTDKEHNVYVFKNVVEAGKFVGLDPSCVRKYCGSRCYHKGYYFKYLYD